MLILIESLVKIIGYTLFFWGLWLIVGTPMVKATISVALQSYYLKTKKRKLARITQNRENQNVPPLVGHLEVLLKAVSDRTEFNVFNFMLLTIIILISTFGTLYSLLNEFVFSLSIALLASSLPYILLRMRLTTLRLKTSEAFLKSFDQVIQLYNTNNDIYYALKELTGEMGKSELKNKYISLYSSMQTSKNKDSFKKASTVFAYSINSTFAKRFAKLTEKAFLDGSDISSSLFDLGEDIQKRRRDMEEERTKKAETIAVGFFPTLLLPLCFFGAYNLAIGKDFWYFFTQKASITVFILALVGTIASAFLAYVLSKNRADI